MLSLKKIAITGVLSCGKSSVCRFLREFGANVVSADEIVHELLIVETPLGQRVAKLVGPGCIQNGKFDRKRIAEVVFKDQHKLQQLEALLHPAVKEEIEKRYADAAKKKNLLFAAEVPLLFEAGWEKDFDAVVVVTAPKQMRLKRFVESTALSAEEFDRRCEKQLTQDEKEKLATHIIENDGSLEELKLDTKHLYQRLITDGE